MVSGCYAKIKTFESLGGEILQPRKHLSPKSMNQDYYSEDIDSRLVLRQEYRKLIKTTDGVFIFVFTVLNIVLVIKCI